jgi:hypothetical protein
MTEPLASLSPDEPLAKGPALWPGWFSDQQIASEHAQHLANALGASVNAGQLAQGWLDANAPAPQKKPRKRKRHRVAVPGAHAVVPPQPQPPPQQRRRKPPSPRGYLTGVGVPAAIVGVLTAILTSLWTAAWALGVSSAIGVLAIGQVETDADAMAALLADGDERIGWILETRLSRLERLLLAALAHHLPADELAEQILAILSSLTSALLVTQTEVSWASGRGAYAVYTAAGVQWVHWVSRRDSRTCPTCLANDLQGPVRLGQPFKSGLKYPPQHQRCRCALAVATAPVPETTQ